MALLKQLFEQLKSSINGITNEIHVLDNKIKSLELERETLLTAPLSKEDYLALLKKEMDKAGNAFAEKISVIIGNDRRGWCELERAEQSRYGLGIPYLGLAMQPGITGTATIEPGALCWFFGEQILKRLDDAVVSLDWPKNAMPVAERKRRLEEIGAQLAELNRQRNALAGELTDAGLRG
jgi:hypothetical protein